MKKNECAQEMLLRLVLVEGCEVTLSPSKSQTAFENALQVKIRHKGFYEAFIIDFANIRLCGADAERITCEVIRRAIERLFRHPYDVIMEKHFGEDTDNAV